MIQFDGGKGERLVAHSAVALPHSGNTTETAVLVVPIPGGALGPNGFVEVEMSWLSTADSSVETCRVRLGSLVGTAFFAYAPGATIASTGTSFLRIANVASESVQIGACTPTAGTGTAGSAGALPSGAIDTSEDWDLYFTIQNGDNTDVTQLARHMVRTVYVP